MIIKNPFYNILKGFVIFFVICLGIPASGQNDYGAKIKEHAGELATAMVNGNFEVLADYTYPNIIMALGGREKMIELVSNEVANLKTSGLSYSEVNVGDPGELFTAGKELHCLIPQKIKLATTDGTLISDSYLLAISSDDGATWYFLDTAQLNNDNAKDLFPDFNPKLVFPEKTQPQFIGN